VTEKGEEGGDSECFVTVPEYFKIDGVSIVEKRKEGDGGVNRYHKEDPDDAAESSVCAIRAGTSYHTVSVPMASGSVLHA
jgi:hypothetical protein